MSITDHLGKVYKNRHEMCAAYGINYGCYKMRKLSGMTQEEALTTPLKRVPKRKEIVQDHLGNIYGSEAEMAKAYGIDPDFLHKRLASGMDIKKALTQEKQERGEVIDHNGNKYETFVAMCRAYDKDISIVKRRLERGESLKDALENRSRGGSVKDHLGNIYKNQKAMLEHYKIDRTTYKNRVNCGWPLQKILETPCHYFPDKNKRKEQRLGQKKLMNNGLYAWVKEYHQRNNIIVEFEDGETRHTGYKDFDSGSVGHPTLNPNGNPHGSFAGFKTKRIKDAYFECECQKCGAKGIFTPKQMMEHEKQCQK